MSTLTLGKDTILKVGSVSGTLVNLTTVAGGATDIELTRTRTTRTIPGGRGSIRNQSVPTVTYDLNFTIDSNSISDPVLRTHNGHRMYCELHPAGESAGQKYVFNGPMTLSMRANLEDNAWVYTASIAVDGRPTVTDN